MPRSQPPKKQYKLGANKAHELDVPSGNTCLVRRPGVQGLIKEGLLDSLDSLTSLVQIEHIDSKDPKKMAEAVQGLAGRKEDLAKGMEMVDRALCAVIVQPKVLPVPKSEEDRDPELLYIDEVDEEDKMFIFQYVLGGSKDLERFREERQKLLGGLQSGEDVSVPA